MVKVAKEVISVVADIIKSLGAAHKDSIINALNRYIEGNKLMQAGCVGCCIAVGSPVVCRARMKVKVPARKILGEKRLGTGSSAPPIKNYN